MRRITKLASLILAVLITVPGLLVLDLFSGARAAPDAPLLFTVGAGESVDLVALSDDVLPSGAFALARVVATEGGDVLRVQERNESGTLLLDRTAPPEGAPWDIHRLQISRDGMTVAAATTDGRILFAASRERVLDSFREFETGSPVTAIDLDASGAYLTAVTYHGDLFVFQREALLDSGAYALHVPAPVPAGAVPGAAGAIDPAAADLLGTGRAGAAVAREAAPFSARPWTHVAFIGAPRTDADPKGLLLAAVTGFAEVYVYDLAGIHSLIDAVALEPHVMRLGDAPCARIPVAQGEVEVPCSRAALDRLLSGMPSTPQEIPQDVALALARAVADAVPLARLLSPVPAHQDVPVVGLGATLGSGADGAHLLVVGLRDGTTEALRVRPGGPAFPGQAGPAPFVERLWRADDARGLQHLELGPFRDNGARPVADLVKVRPDGVVSVHLVEVGARAPPIAHIQTRIDDGPVRHVALSRGDATRADDPTVARYLFVGTEGGMLRLFQTRDVAGPDPLLLWAGTSPGAVPLRAAWIQDEGGVAVAADGVAVYGNLVSASIDAPAKVDRHKEWMATAQVRASDIPVDSVSWRLEPVETRTPTSVVTASGASFAGAFAHEGLYRVVVTVKDERGIEVQVARDLVVGGRNPVVKLEAPAAVAVGEEAVISLVGTHDPNLPDGSGHGIDRIEVHPYSDARKGMADLDTMTYRFRAEGPTGIYRTTVIAYDSEGRSTRASATIQVTAPGFTLLGEPAGHNVFVGVATARDSAHTAAFGGNNQGARLQVRAPDGSLLFEEATGTKFTSGALTPDGALFVGGRSDGSAVRIPLADPAARTTLQVFDAPVRWTFVSDDGLRVLFVAEDGRIAAGPGNLSKVSHAFALGEPVSRAAADERLIHAVLLTQGGSVLVVDGHRPDKGVRDEHAPEATVTALAITPNLDPVGRLWVFLGFDDGRVEVLRVLVHDFASVGVAAFDAGGRPIVSLAAGRVDERSRYTFAALSRNDRIDCAPGPSNPCGFLVFADSRGPRADGMPLPARSVQVESRSSHVLMDAEARRFLVVGASANPRVAAYDTFWDEGPLSVVTGLGGRVLSGAMIANAAGYLLVENGRLAWMFAPPRASILVGPHDETGTPEWGGRVHAQRDVTLSGLNSTSGYGSIVAYQWQLGDNGASTAPSPVHSWPTRGWHEVWLTVTSRVTHPVETLVSDRAMLVVMVHDPPPVPRLTATPFNISSGAVEVTSGDMVRFDASQSSHPTGARLVNYRFNTGTGYSTNSAAPVLEFVYPKSGVYHASVRVTDEHGNAATSERIRVEVANRGPQAAFTFELSAFAYPAGRVGAHVPVTFDAAAATDPDGSVVAWEWEFPGGVTRSEREVAHTFYATGDQTVRLRVRDNSGTWSTWAQHVVQVDTGIRVDAEQDPVDGSTVAPTQRVRVFGHTHDLAGYPGQGAAFAAADITVRVFFDGFASTPSTTPYETSSHTADAEGDFTHDVGFNQAGLTYKPGRYRVEISAVAIGVYGDPLPEATAQTSFWVDA